jgi:hypothetical protein
MSRRSTPERLEQARRSATLARLVSAGMLPDRAAAALAAWEARKVQDCRTIVADDWDGAYREIVGQPMSGFLRPDGVASRS